MEKITRMKLFYLVKRFHFFIGSERVAKQKILSYNEFDIEKS